MASYGSHETQLSSIKKAKLMDSLPDEIWSKIFEIGIEKTNYSLRDIYSLLISCKLFNRLWNEDAPWCLLLTLDFPRYVNDHSPASQSYSSCKKLLYKYSLTRYCKTEFHYFQRQFDRVQSRIGVLSQRILRLQDRIKAGSQFLEELSLKWDQEIHKGRHAIALMGQPPFPSVAPSTTTPPISAPSTPPVSAPAAASPTRAPSLSTSADDSSFIHSLIVLKAKTDEVLSHQEDKISKYERQREQMSALLRIQRDHYKQLETLTSCLTSLSSGCNPIEIGDIEVDDDDDYDDDNDYDDDEEDEDDFDNDVVEYDIDGLPVELD